MNLSKIFSGAASLVFSGVVSHYHYKVFEAFSNHIQLETLSTQIGALVGTFVAVPTAVLVYKGAMALCGGLDVTKTVEREEYTPTRF